MTKRDELTVPKSFCNALAQELENILNITAKIVFNIVIMLSQTMNKIKCPVNTFCYSMAASMAAVILACGEKRYAFKHSKIMIHQPLLNFEGRYRQSDLSVEARELEETRFDLETILTDSTKGKTTFEEMHKACEKDNYLKPEVALKMGLIDEIV